MNKNSLITSDKIYYKLLWHENADTKKATITFLNLGKLKTISFCDWIPMEKGGEIPWHRIYQFHYQNEILWDRNERIMNLELLNSNDEIFNNIEMLEYINKKWIISKKDTQVLPNYINIITFNCLMDIYDKHITDIKPRLPIICQYIEKYNADIVCLQEITIKMKKIIMDYPFIQKNYFITSNEAKIYGQMILSKFKPLSYNLVTLNGNHMKKYLHLLFKNSKDENIEIYNIHLTSNDQAYCEEKRKLQINQIINQIKYDKVILLGDFNSEFKVDNFIDIWENLKPNENGYTFDYIENELTNKVTRKFNRVRIDKILLKNMKPENINLAFNEPIDKIFPSDHFGLISKISTIDHFDINYNLSNNFQKYILKPGNVLCIILNPKYWSKLNEIRKLYDEGYLKIPPHITLFQRFIDINEWLELKEHFIPINNKIFFDKIEIFELTIKFVVVLTSSQYLKINESRKNLENILNIQQNTTPHITLGEFDNIKKAINLKNNIEKNINDFIFEINLQNICYMKKVNEQYLIYDKIGNYNDLEVLELISIIISNITNNYKLEIIGSRVFKINDTDYDIVITSNLEEDYFFNRLNSFCKMCPYFKYVNIVNSKINSVNLITENNDELNLMYSKIENNKFQINNIFINDSIEHIKIIKNFINDKFDFLCECYKCVKTWANLKNIYGSKYGFLNGVSWLYLTLNLLLKENFKNKKIFFKKFIEFYNQYDWNIPININNKIIEKINPSDNIIYISSLTINKSNIVRNISNNTFKIILNEFKIANEFNIENINDIFIKKKIINRYLKITINDQFEFNRIDKKNKISSEIWKLNIKNNFIPTCNWIEKNNTFIYIIGINEFTNIEELINYFKKFNVLCEIKNL